MCIDTGNKGENVGFCGICCALIAALVCLIVGCIYLDTGETEFIKNEQEIDDIEDRMIQYSFNATGSALNPTTTEVVYGSTITNPPGVPLVDPSFTVISNNALRYQRTTMMYGIQETTVCQTQQVSVRCRKSSSNSNNNNDEYTNVLMDGYRICQYTYTETWMAEPAACANTFIDTPGWNTPQPATYPANQKCSDLTSNPNIYYYTDATVRATYQPRCNTWTSAFSPGTIIYAAPCTSNNCATQTDVTTYNLGPFTVTDHYIFDAYFNQNPTSNQLTFASGTTQNGWTTCTSNCGASGCNHLYASQQNPAGNGTVCDRVQSNSPLYGDQKVSWTVWPGDETVWVCTKQRYQNNVYSLEQASNEGGGTAAQNMMDVDYDIIQRTELTKDYCIDKYRDENDKNLSAMRTLCGFLLVFSCIFYFCSFACCFDTFTDIITLVPQILGRALLCGFGGISDAIQCVEDCADRIVYFLCVSIGACIGLPFFGMIFAIIYVKARYGGGGFAAILIVCVLFFVAVFVVAGFFIKFTVEEINNRGGAKQPADAQDQMTANQGPQETGIMGQITSAASNAMNQVGQMSGQQGGFTQQPPQQNFAQPYQPQQGYNQPYQPPQQGYVPRPVNPNWGPQPNYAFPPTYGGQQDQDLNRDGIPDKYQINLPPHYECRMDPQSGRPYWVNHQTQQSTWQDPRI